MNAFTLVCIFIASDNASFEHRSYSSSDRKDRKARKAREKSGHHTSIKEHRSRQRLNWSREKIPFDKVQQREDEEAKIEDDTWQRQLEDWEREEREEERKIKKRERERERERNEYERNKALHTKRVQLSLVNASPDERNYMRRNNLPTPCMCCGMMPWFCDYVMEGEPDLVSKIYSNYDIWMDKWNSTLVSVWWIKFRHHVKLRMVAMYWWGCMQKSICAPGGRGRENDRIAYIQQFQ